MAARVESTRGGQGQRETRRHSTQRLPCNTHCCRQRPAGRLYSLPACSAAAAASPAAAAAACSAASCALRSSSAATAAVTSSLLLPRPCSSFRLLHRGGAHGQGGSEAEGWLAGGAASAFSPSRLFGAAPGPWALGWPGKQAGEQAQAGRQAGAAPHLTSAPCSATAAAAAASCSAVGGAAPAAAAAAGLESTSSPPCTAGNSTKGSSAGLGVQRTRLHCVLAACGQASSSSGGQDGRPPSLAASSPPPNHAAKAAHALRIVKAPASPPTLSQPAAALPPARPLSLPHTHTPPHGAHAHTHSLPLSLPLSPSLSPSPPPSHLGAILVLPGPDRHRLPHHLPRGRLHIEQRGGADVEAGALEAPAGRRRRAVVVVVVWWRRGGGGSSGGGRRRARPSLPHQLAPPSLPQLAPACPTNATHHTLPPHAPPHSATTLFVTTLCHHTPPHHTVPPTCATRHSRRCAPPPAPAPAQPPGCPGPAGEM